MAELALPAAVLEEVRLDRPLEPAFLVNRSPEPGSAGVPRTTRVLLDILGGPGAAVRREQVDVRVDGELAFLGASSAPFGAGYAQPGSQVVDVPGGVRIALQPGAPFRSLQAVTVHALVRASGGAVVLEQAYGFVVEDVTAPRLLAAEAVSPTRVRLGFDEPVLTGDIAVSFEALDVPAVPLSVTSAVVDGNTMELAVWPAMSPDVRYRVQVAGVTDAAGNGVQAPEDVAVFRGYRPPRPVERRFDLWSMVPRHNRREDESGDLRKLIACFQEVTDLLLADIDRFADLFDIERAPEDFVDFLLLDLGNPFEFVLNELDKRRLASVLVELYQLKGTEKGIRNAVRFFLGIEIDAITTFSGSPLILGESLLGVDWELGPSDRFALYAFEVHVPIVLTDEQRARLRALILWAKPSHTHLVAIRELTGPEPIDVWFLGESDLGLNTVLA